MEDDDGVDEVGEEAFCEDGVLFYELRQIVEARCWELSVRLWSVDVGVM